MSTLPKQTNAVILHEGFGMTYGQFDLPALGAGDVLVKIHSSVVNPSDVGFITGVYAQTGIFPTVPGFEASGKVVAAGADAHAQSLVGKNVTFFAKGDKLGGWAEYAVASSRRVMPLPGNLTLEQGATCLINPLTAQGFIEISKE